MFHWISGHTRNQVRHYYISDEVWLYASMGANNDEKLGQHVSIWFGHNQYRRPDALYHCAEES